MLVLKNKPFARFQKKARLTDADIWNAAQAAERGLVDADMGGGVIKQRIARSGQGKSGGVRSVILYRRGKRAVFVYGFEKKDRANIREDELEAFRELAGIVLGYTDVELAAQVERGTLLPISGPEE